MRWPWDDSLTRQQRFPESCQIILSILLIHVLIPPHPRLPRKQEQHPAQEVKPRQ